MRKTDFRQPNDIIINSKVIHFSCKIYELPEIVRSREFHRSKYIFSERFHMNIGQFLKILEILEKFYKICKFIYSHVT